MLSRLRIDRLKGLIFGTAPIRHMTPDQRLQGIIRLGDSLEEAKETDLYKFLTQRALSEHDGAVEEWLTADPTNVSKMVELQSKARRLEAFTKWMDDAIQEGRAAFQELKRQEHSDG